MKTTVLKASKALAEKISADLLKIPSKVNPGSTIFIRVEKEDGFVIQNRNKNAPVIVLIYKDKPAPLISYNETIVTID